jgi:hypothetical protein
MSVFFVTDLSTSRPFILLIRIALHEFIYGSSESLELEEIKEGYEVFIQPELGSFQLKKRGYKILLSFDLLFDNKMDGRVVKYCTI